MLNPVAVQRALQKVPIETFTNGAYWTLVAIAAFIGAGLAGAIINQWISASAITTDFSSNLAALRTSLNSPVLEGDDKKDYTIIGSRPLISLVANTQQSVGGQIVKKSDLPLTLIGTFVEKGKAPYAIVEEKKSNTQDVFSVGDLVFGEANLKRILTDRIEINRNGVLEVLILDEKVAAKGFDGPETFSEEQTHFSVAENELDQALENLPLLLTQARAVPYFKDGKAVGLRMFAIRKGSMYEKIGLKNGDILKTVNGNSLGDVTQAMKLFEQLKSERDLKLNLERNGQSKDFSYEIR